MDSGLLSGHWSLWIGSSCIFFYQPARARRGVSNMETMWLCAEFVLLMWWYETNEFQRLYERYKRLPSFLLDKHCLARFGMHASPPYCLTYVNSWNHVPRWTSHLVSSTFFAKKHMFSSHLSHVGFGVAASPWRSIPFRWSSKKHLKVDGSIKELSGFIACCETLERLLAFAVPCLPDDLTGETMTQKPFRFRERGVE